MRDSKKIFLAAKCAKSRKINGKQVILNMDKGYYYQLNAVGTFFWNLLDGKKTIAEIVSMVSREYVAGKELVLQDVLELVAELKKEGLVQEAGVS